MSFKIKRFGHDLITFDIKIDSAEFAADLDKQRSELDARLAARRRFKDAADFGLGAPPMPSGERFQSAKGFAERLRTVIAGICDHPCGFRPDLLSAALPRVGERPASHPGKTARTTQLQRREPSLARLRPRSFWSSANG